jgi:hypothetical protein
VSPSSTTMRCPAAPKASPDSLASMSASASGRDDVTRTPLPAASPSVLMTHGPGKLRRKERAGPGSSKTSKRAVGTPAVASTSFMNAFEPSSRAPSAPGPNTSRPSALRRSARPSTSGASGPMTKRSASIRPMAWASSTEPPTDSSVWPSGVRPPIPGLPGTTTTSAVRPRAMARACSRPPEPTTHTRRMGPAGTPRSPALMRRSARTVRDRAQPRPGAPGLRSARPRSPRSRGPLAADLRARWLPRCRSAIRAALRKRE